MGRVTNYGAIGGDMVPPGKGCICVEYFCTAEDPLINEPGQRLFELALGECTGARLVDPDSYTGHLVIKRPLADPAVSWEDYVTDTTRSELFKRVSQFSNLYQINRTGTDKSTHAALMAANAIIGKDRKQFIRQTKPDIAIPWEVF
jgi:hypothetical protein